MKKEKNGIKLTDGIIVCLFLLVLFIPGIISLMNHVYPLPLFMKLNGYQDKVEVPPLSAETYFSGEFQDKFSQNSEQDLSIRALFVKTANTLQWYAFRYTNTNVLITEDENLFEYVYADAEYAIDDYDFHKEEVKEEADQVIEHLASVRNKLKSVGKELVVMLCPSKAMFTHDQLDPIYQEKKEADAINGREYYLQALKDNKIPFVDSASYANEAKYPLFYPFGIHWSLTYGQLCTTKLIDRCEELTGNTYDNLVLDEVIESKSPFRNEEDLLWLMNVVSIGKTPTYHKYVEKREHNPNSKPLKIFLYGDSFGEMIQAFIQTTIEEDDVTLLNRDQFVCEGDGCNVSMDRPLQEINHDFNNVDLKRHLDESDVVVIEMVDPELAKFTYGFAEYLDGYLDSYIADRKAGK